MTRIFIALIAATALLACDKEQATPVPTPAEPATAAQPTDPKPAEEPAAAKPEAATTATVGQPAPAFELLDESGTKHTLEQYRGKTVVLEWTCPTCPYVKRHYQEKTMDKSVTAVGEDVVWLAIDSTRDDKAVDPVAWKKEQGFAYPVLIDRDGKVGKQYAAKTTPHMFVIDKDGVLRYDGAIDDDPRGQKKVEERTNMVIKAVEAVKSGGEVPDAKNTPYGCGVKYAS